ncbi:MAG: hypothetical protein JW999_03670 [Methanotrichaceae archaeon]|nr:hypothetical protein [Methanotrichaceae archaeon]
MIVTWLGQSCFLLDLGHILSTFNAPKKLQMAREDLYGEDEVVLLTCSEAEGAADR